MIQSGGCLHCCLCKHGGRHKETEQHRKTDQWRQSRSNTSLRDWSARLEHKSTLIVLAEDDILAASDDECYSSSFFSTRAIVLGRVWGRGAGVSRLLWLVIENKVSDQALKKVFLHLSRGNEARWGGAIIMVVRMCWVFTVWLAHCQTRPAVFSDRGTLSFGN